jgi:uncharacterized protein (TIGR03437 family)
MLWTKLAVPALLLVLSSPSAAQQLHQFAALPQGYTIAVVATGPGGRLFAVGSFEPGDPSRPKEDQADAFAAAFSPDGEDLLYLRTWLGRRNDVAVGVAVDSAGAAYVAVQTASANLVGTPGSMQRNFLAHDNQSFVAKLDPEGVVVYQTFIGGESNTTIQAVSVRDTGEAVITGQSSGEGFPTTPDAAIASEDSATGFVVLLDPEGAAARFSVRGIGGSALAFNEEGDVYVGGWVFGNGAVPITPGAFQATHESRACAGGWIGIPCSYGYVAALAGDGTKILFATFLTGDNGSAISAISVDAAGDVIVAGSTHSKNFPETPSPSKGGLPEPAVPVPPIVPPPSRGFVAKLNADGTKLLYSTLLGGSGEDTLSAMRIGPDSIYVTGSAGSYDLPGLSALPQCMPAGLVAELSLNGEVKRAVAFDRLAGANPALAFGADGALRVSGGNAVLAVDFDAAAPRIACVNEAATLSRANTAAPGSLLSLFGQGLAAEPLVAAPDADGLFPTSLGGVAVHIGGRPAPLLYVSPRQINLQVPFETETGVADLEIDAPSAAEPTRKLAVETRRPAVFLNPPEGGPCPSLDPFYFLYAPAPLPLAFNEDGTANSCRNPAPPGTRASIFLTGVGPTAPLQTTGAKNADPPAALPLDASLGFTNADITATSLTGSISGVWKVEFRIPPEAYGPLNIYPVIDGVAAYPRRVVIWVRPAP